MSILLGDFNAKVGREDIFKPTIGNESLHEINNENGVRLVNFATYKTSKSKVLCSHIATSINTWTSPDGKTQNQIDHIQVDRRRHSNILDVRSYRAADCDKDHYPVATKVRGRLAANKQRWQRFHHERFNPKKLNEVGDNEQYRIEVSNRFAALEDLDSEVEINSAWEMIIENIKISAKESLGYCELNKHKSWFDQSCSKLTYQRKQAKLKWL
jgi:hypothetical protein